MSNPFRSPDNEPNESAAASNPFASNPSHDPALFAPGRTSPLNPFSLAQGRPLAPQGSTAASTRRPVSVKTATCALLLAGLLTLTLAGFAIWAIMDLRESLDRLMQLDPTHTAAFLASGYADDTETALMAGVAVVATSTAVAYMVVAVALWNARTWPRIVSPFLAVLSIPAVFLGHVALVIVLAGVGATAAAWLPSARAFSSQRGQA